MQDKKFLILGPGRLAERSIQIAVLARLEVSGKKVLIFDVVNAETLKQRDKDYPPVPPCIFEEMLMNSKIEASPVVQFFRKRAYDKIEPLIEEPLPNVNPIPTKPIDAIMPKAYKKRRY